MCNLTFSLVLFNFLLDILLAVGHFVAILHVGDFGWNVIKPREEEEQNGAHFAGECEEKHVLCHILVIVEQARATSTRTAVVLLPQDAALVNKSAKNYRCWNGAQNSYHDPLNS
jgi:hypothetical protein